GFCGKAVRGERHPAIAVGMEAAAKNSAGNRGRRSIARRGGEIHQSEWHGERPPNGDGSPSGSVSADEASAILGISERGLRDVRNDRARSSSLRSRHRGNAAGRNSGVGGRGENGAAV